MPSPSPSQMRPCPATLCGPRSLIPPRDTLGALHKDCSVCIVVGALKREGCTLHIRSVPAVAIDCDRCQAFALSSVQKPDFVILYDGSQAPPDRPQSQWIVVEMERRIKNADEVVRQLEAGATAALEDVHFVDTGLPSTLRGLALHSAGCHADEAQAIMLRGIRVRGRKFPVLVRKAAGSGVQLLDRGQALEFRSGK